MNEDSTSRCPACGEPIDYCMGHGETGDPDGHAVLAAHDADDHSTCDPRGCDAVCEEFATDGSCIHSDHMARAGA
jgi:hypothetical protein